VIKVEAFDHVVLVCRDVSTTLQWYQDALGLEGVRVEAWRRGEVPFPSVRVNGDTIIDLIASRGEPAAGPARNVDHLCLVVAPTDFDALVASGRFEVVDGPGPRFGARGMGTSLYVKDPDGSTVELRYYPG
jgi:catechol 2,3-dioxygenase-like lactoylglutathione lyase family enzyme